MSEVLSGDVQGEQACLLYRQRSMGALGWVLGMLEEWRAACKGEVSGVRSRTVGHRRVWNLTPHEIESLRGLK